MRPRARARGARDEALDRLEHGPVGGEHWSLVRFGAYRSAAAAIETWGLVLTSLESQGTRDDDPAVLHEIPARAFDHTRRDRADRRSNGGTAPGPSRGARARGSRRATR